MKASDYIARYIENQGVTHVFELVGGMITFLVDSLSQQTRVNIVSMHHEQGAGFAAEGYGRIRSIPGVALATSGPGATNLLTAIGSCYFDSVPTVFITGQVNRHELKGERRIRQLGFQETDIVAITKPITKASWIVSDPARLPELLEEAFSLAMHGRKGPVLLDVPLDVQRAEVEDLSRLSRPISRRGLTIGNNPGISEFLTRLDAALKKANRPVIIAGGGISSAAQIQRFRRLAKRWGIPVVNSLMGVDSLPAEDPLRVGLIGSYGNRWANTLLSEADLLLVLGSRLDIRQTGADTASFKRDRQIFHVDCDPGELNNRVQDCITLTAQLDEFLAAAELVPKSDSCWDAWRARIEEYRKRWPDTEEAKVDGINPNYLMRAVSKGSEDAAAYVVDVGQHQMWAAQSLQLLPHQRFLTSGGMGAMGFALPAAIGACIAADRPVVMFAGDGGFQLNIQELQTIQRNKLPVKMVVVNNGCHGMVRQFQESYFKGRYQSTMWGYSAPSFSAVAKAYGIDSLRIDSFEHIDPAIISLWESPQKPFLLEVVISPNANAYPKMAFGKPMSEMEPLAKPLDMEGT